MPEDQTPPLVTTAWLAEHLDDPKIVLLDGSFKLPGVAPTAAEDYRARHIPGAQFFDIDAVADPGTDLPHMLPSAEAFAEVASRMGISNDTMVVVYDTPGLMSAGRVWWTFRVFGHDRVAVLDGGLKAWLAERRPVTDAVPLPGKQRFVSRFRPELVRSRAQMLSNLASPTEQVIDARSAGRFAGTEPEARPGLRGGRIPGSLNLPFNLLTDPETGRTRSPEALTQLFEAAGLAADKPVVATCGSGVTAAALAFGLHLTGRTDVAVYDGSWAEWGRPGDTPVDKG